MPRTGLPKLTIEQLEPRIAPTVIGIASIGSAGQQGDDDSLRPAISADGRYIAYLRRKLCTLGILVAGAWGTVASCEVCDIPDGGGGDPAPPLCNDSASHLGVLPGSAVARARPSPSEVMSGNLQRRCAVIR